MVLESAPTASGPTLIVMTFANLEEGPETKIYAQGLTEEVLSQIARFKELSGAGTGDVEEHPSRCQRGPDPP